MITKVTQWGNSQGVRFSKEILTKIDISIGDSVEIYVEDGNIIVKPIDIIRKKYRLEDLLKEIPSDSENGEIDWGKIEGKEVW